MRRRSWIETEFYVPPERRASPAKTCRRCRCPRSIGAVRQEASQTMSYLSDPMLFDRFQRPLRSLRISVTDRCNLRCQYCMPEQDYVWLPRESLLTFEETTAIVDAFTPLGVDRVRITGGEPLLRRDLAVLIESLAARTPITDLAMTTNGVLLASNAASLRAAGLHRITVSLDTLD